jgi:hypothetical protein
MYRMKDVKKFNANPLYTPFVGIATMITIMFGFVYIIWKIWK